MGYEQKYKEALERARKLGTREMPIDSTRSIQEQIFPELKESEDERIRKSLIRNFTNQHSSNFPTVDGFTREQIIAWLEKQDENKSVEIPALVCPKCMKSFDTCKDYPSYHNRINYICPHCGYDGDSTDFETAYNNHPIERLYWNTTETWKPSKEQMNALNKAKNSPANYYDIRLGLQSLYNDLLKL